VLYVLPAIPDDADEATKDALAIRNAWTTEGRCPDCGAVGAVHPDAEVRRIEPGAVRGRTRAAA